MKHLVLGSSGQIGAYLVDYLSSKGEQVIPWDVELSSDHDLSNKNLVELHLKPILTSCDFVHFLAFDVGGSNYLAKYQDTYSFVDNNINLMNNVFALLEQTQKPFYFASSQMSNMFHSTYGRLKAIGESYTNSLNGVNVRFWNVYGYETNPEKTHVITDFIKMALSDNRIIMRTSGVEERNFLYAKDAACLLDGVANSILNDVKNTNFLKSSIDNYGAVPILTSSPFVSIIKIAEIVRGIIDPNIEIYANVHKKDSVQGFKNEIDLEFISHLNKSLGLKHETSLYTGIKEMINKYKNWEQK